jgi:hypothetical protein
METFIPILSLIYLDIFGMAAAEQPLLTSLTNKKAELKAALRIDLNTQLFYSVDGFVTYDSRSYYQL